MFFVSLLSTDLTTYHQHLPISNINITSQILLSKSPDPTMYVQIPCYCPRCSAYFPAEHPRSETPPNNWRHPFDFPPLLDHAPPVVRYCDKCRKEPGVSRYLKAGVLLDEYLSYCDDAEYVKLVRERIAKETEAGKTEVVKRISDEECARLSKKEREERKKKEKLREFHKEETRVFFEDLRVLQEKRIGVLRGEPVVGSADGRGGESRSKGLFGRLRRWPNREGNSATGEKTRDGHSESMPDKGSRLGYGHDGEDVNIDEYDSDDSSTIGGVSLLSVDTRHSLGGETLRGDLDG